MKTKKWFQVTKVSAHSLTGMLGLNLAFGVLSDWLSLPRSLLAFAVQRSSYQLPALSNRSRRLETTFRSPTATARCRTTSVGSKLLVYLFSILLNAFQTRSASNSTPRRPLLAGRGASTSIARCPIVCPVHLNRLSNSHSSFGSYSVRIIARCR